MTSRRNWMTAVLMISCNKKAKLYKKYILTRSISAKNRYTLYKNKLVRLLKIAKKTYYFNKIRSCAGNLRKTWELINNLMNKPKRENIINCFTTDNGVNVT